MNRDALTLPRQALLPALQERAAAKASAITARDARWGAGRSRVTSYMENIGWPGLFGFDMNDFYADPELGVEMQLRQKLFWADNVDDDSPVTFNVAATTGWYYDMTLFGQRIRHTPDGVPEFEPHPLSRDPDPALPPPFDFYATGDMPALIARYRRMREIVERDDRGCVQVDFPHFHRGPLDVFTQMRGYENFMDDARLNPERVFHFLNFIVDERLRFARERQAFLGEPDLPATTFVADDWVNVPFISPRLFRTFATPSYQRIVANEGPVTGFHTCGNIEAVALDLLNVFPAMPRLEVSGWNNVAVLDEITPAEIGFDIHFINTFVLNAPEEEQQARLKVIARISRRRPVSLCAQAMVPFPTYDATLLRLARFLALAREELGNIG